MNNSELARVFKRIAALTELKGESVFVVRAYQRAARTIDELSVELTQYVAEGRDLKEIPGVGQAIAKKVRELLETGKLRFYERLKAEFPDAILHFIDIPGVGPKTALRFCVELGTTTVEELETALRDGRVAALPRMGEKVAKDILLYIHSQRPSPGSAQDVPVVH